MCRAVPSSVHLVSSEDEGIDISAETRSIGHSDEASTSLGTLDIRQSFSPMASEHDRRILEGLPPLSLVSQNQGLHGVLRQAGPGSGPGYLSELGAHSYRMTISYEGTEYRGWQLQPDFPSIQGSVEHALCTALREPREKLKVQAAGRTDRGVHAIGQVVQFYSDNSGLDGPGLAYKLNRLLPPDIRVVSLNKTAPDFIVTISAVSKTYHYYVDNAPEHNPIMRRFRMHVAKPLDLDAMRESMQLIQGTHDFTQFSNNAESGRKRNPIKTMHRVDLVELGDGNLRFEFEGSGFLYKMVRHLTGVMLAIGSHSLPPDYVRRQLEVGRKQTPGAGGKYRGYKVALSKGLFLANVRYIPGVDDPDRLLYPDMAHDSLGRLLDFLPVENEEE
ncbi:hypothetical protein CEUSTIGMA_g9982.t1 [Chlamydomonas eustigma]|uniref:tRNA pseudouridine synthase n=1 Tax=Chlamydomonas eustigma TaxID=1157962 RepID=A0A250XHT4_9CHLO|nr:hypothetical protein CEUSTIGMA_g9982.t1 [Chlamydomonas eustigma]|eukprot:GAX82556.1 hypothetical protein CEUSTIGMA_g9982.t1 [Chlamydomonas eustigma]